MSLWDFANALGVLCSRSTLAPERPLRWTIIANPIAGGFTIRSRWKRHQAALKTAIERAGAFPLREDARPTQTALAAGSLGLIPTQGPGHGGRIVQTLLDEAAAGEKGVLYLLITAGGDGTSLESLVPLFNASPSLRSRFVVLRLPMGTGNDGADAGELGAALERLFFPGELAEERALRLRTASGRGPFLAFNILSVGLDAFVTHMTNRMKGNLPGDSYKLWVDLAALFYDRLYRVGPLEVRAFDETGSVVRSFREKVLLMAVGVSGHRSYGSQKRILPDERNVCVLRQMSLRRKLALKGPLAEGRHGGAPEVSLFHADRVEFRGAYPLLAQMDGETTLLGPKDFPATIERTAPGIPVIRARKTEGPGLL